MTSYKENMIKNFKSKPTWMDQNVKFVDSESIEFNHFFPDN